MSSSPSAFAGVGLGVALAPADLALHDAGQVLALLLVGAVLQQRRPDHREAEADQGQRQLVTLELLAVDLDLGLVEAAAAVLLGPAGSRQAALGHELAVALRQRVRQLGIAPAPVVARGRPAELLRDSFEELRELAPKGLDVRHFALSPTRTMRRVMAAALIAYGEHLG
jgi:hypothetical protein